MLAASRSAPVAGKRPQNRLSLGLRDKAVRCVADLDEGRFNFAVQYIFDIFLQRTLISKRLGAAGSHLCAQIEEDAL